MDFSKNLPTESLIKEFENNPLKILEAIRNERESEAFININQESKKDEGEIVNNKKKEKNSISSNKDKGKLEESKLNDNSASFDLIKNKKQNLKDANRKKIINNINNINTSNNINFNNTLINYNPNANLNNSNNIIVNHLNIFLNFNANNNNNSDNKNSNNKNQNVNKNKKLVCNNNKINENCKSNNDFCNDNNLCNNFSKNINTINNINQHSNFDENNINNLLLYNINKLLNNLKSYKGSIICQALIDSIDDQKQLSQFFQNLIPHICQIMCQEYGNYFFQKLIKKLNAQQRLNIYQIIEPEFLVIATNKCGTHSIQSLMETIETAFELLALNKLISKNMLLLFTDDNAYHIMMKMILDFPEDKRNILNIFLVTNIEKIITNCNGAFCVNKFIINNKNLNFRKLLVENLKNNLKKIVFNKFSCINLLLILQTFGVEWGAFIIKGIEENFVIMTQNPISNVFITKVLEYLSDNNVLVLKLLIWSLYKNFVLINYLISNKNHKKLLNLIIGYSDNEQKQYLYALLKKSNW